MGILTRLAALRPAWLIAEREFKFYVATASFWIALAIGPALMLGASFVVPATLKPDAPSQIAIDASDPGLRTQAIEALVAAGKLEGRAFIVAASPRPAPRLELRRVGGQSIEARFGAGFPLTSAGQTLVLRTLERDAARADAERATLTVRLVPPPSAPARTSPMAGRLVLVIMLWLTLTGSLGMLLVAVARERANRALECLLAAARPWQIVLGKLSGVGAVSLLVLASWIGSATIAGSAAPGGAHLMRSLFADLANPAAIAGAVGVYLLAYVLYGLAVVAVGAAAQDTAAAQNWSRPIFAVLLAVFFTSLAAASGAEGVGWLTFAPPFTPFLLLLTQPSPWIALAGAALVAVTAAAAGSLAVHGLQIAPAQPRFWRTVRHALKAVRA